MLDDVHLRVLTLWTFFKICLFSIQTRVPGRPTCPTTDYKFYLTFDDTWTWYKTSSHSVLPSKNKKKRWFGWIRFGISFVRLNWTGRLTLSGSKSRRSHLRIVPCWTLYFILIWIKILLLDRPVLVLLSCQIGHLWRAWGPFRKKLRF